MQGAAVIQKTANSGDDDMRVTHADASILAVPELEKLQLILDRALRISARSQFYSWTQGILQALLPHEVLVCALAKPYDLEFLIDIFPGAPLATSDVAFLQKRVGGFVDRAVLAWKMGGRRPLLCKKSEVQGSLAEILAGTSFENFSTHGISSFDGHVASLFILLNQSPTCGSREMYLLETFTPFLHATWLRVHLAQSGSDKSTSASPGTGQSLLSAREIEVIRWIHDGKSNSQIGGLLKISPLTVKNHVQKILRKLNVQNRTQAVSKSLALKIIDPARRL